MAIQDLRNMKTICLTLDYELYGNGSGDVFKNIIEPTNQILSILHKHNIHISIFLEVVEYWKLKEEWDRGNKMGYESNPVEAINDQLRKAYTDGHDIQLHIHPQWVDAKYIDGKWHVNLNEWRLGNYHREGENSLKNLLLKGKQTIEDIIRPIDPEYKCIALRAGGYNAQPSQDIVRAMNEVGLTVDSSIYPGGKESGILSNYDYSCISPEYGFWHVGVHLEEQGSSQILELPITAFPIKRFSKYLSISRIKAILANKSSAKESFESKTSMGRSGLLHKLKYFFETEWQTWDFCLFPARMHKKFITNIRKQTNRDLYVLVGHPKSFTGPESLEYLLRNIKFSHKFLTINKLPEIYS